GLTTAKSQASSGKSGYELGEKAAAAAAVGSGYGQGYAPEFDWDGWNLQMQEQQAAVWASMDAMNAEFLNQQEAWQAAQGADIAPRRGINSFNTGGVSPDQARVRRKKKKKPSAAASGTKLSIGGSQSAGGVSLGGASGGKSLGIG
ncbi:hypothetical protein SXHG_00065, partial [Synechococcus phage MRHenn-2013a]